MNYFWRELRCEIEPEQDSLDKIIEMLKFANEKEKVPQLKEIRIERGVKRVNGKVIMTLRTVLFKTNNEYGQNDGGPTAIRNG